MRAVTAAWSWASARVWHVGDALGMKVQTMGIQLSARTGDASATGWSKTATTTRTTEGVRGSDVGTLGTRRRRLLTHHGLGWWASATKEWDRGQQLSRCGTRGGSRRRMRTA